MFTDRLLLKTYVVRGYRGDNLDDAHFCQWPQQTELKLDALCLSSTPFNPQQYHVLQKQFVKYFVCTYKIANDYCR